MYWLPPWMEVRAEGSVADHQSWHPLEYEREGWGTKTKYHLKGTVVLYYFWKFRHCTLVGCWITELQRGHKSPCLGSSWGFLCKVIQVFTFYMNSSCRGKAISVALWIFHRKIKKVTNALTWPLLVFKRGCWGTETQFSLKGTIVIYYLRKFYVSKSNGSPTAVLQKGHKWPYSASFRGFLWARIHFFRVYMDRFCKYKTTGVTFLKIDTTIKILHMFKCSA